MFMAITHYQWQKESLESSDSHHLDTANTGGLSVPWRSTPNADIVGPDVATAIWKREKSTSSRKGDLFTG